MFMYVLRTTSPRHLFQNGSALSAKHQKPAFCPRRPLSRPTNIYFIHPRLLWLLFWSHDWCKGCWLNTWLNVLPRQSSSGVYEEFCCLHQRQSVALCWTGWFVFKLLPWRNVFSEFLFYTPSKFKVCTLKRSFPRNMKFKGFKDYCKRLRIQHFDILWISFSNFDLLYRKSILMYIFWILSACRTRIFFTLYRFFIGQSKVTFIIQDLVRFIDQKRAKN